MNRLLIVSMASLWLACSDDPGERVYRSCPALPSQMAPDERVLIDISTAEERSIARTLTTSVSAAGGYIEVYESPSASSPFGSTFSATVDRVGARIVCNSELVVRAAEPVPVYPTN